MALRHCKCTEVLVLPYNTCLFVLHKLMPGLTSHYAQCSFYKVMMDDGSNDSGEQLMDTCVDVINNKIVIAQLS